MKTLISIAFLVTAMTGCASVHRSSSGHVTAEFRGGPDGAVSVMEASADLSTNDTSLEICREAIVSERACMAFDSRTGRPLVVVGGGSVPYGYFGQSSTLSAAAAIGEAERLRLENIRLRSDIDLLTRPASE
jgi:hypothetical protein